jgi:hypothetical protein
MMAGAILWIVHQLMLFSFFIRSFALSSRPINPAVNKVLPASADVSIVTNLIAGAVARGVSILVMYPLDTLKTRFQVCLFKFKAASL